MAPTRSSATTPPLTTSSSHSSSGLTCFHCRTLVTCAIQGLRRNFEQDKYDHSKAVSAIRILHRENVNGTTVPLLNTPNHKLFASGLYSGIPRVRLVAAVNHESSRAAQDDAGVLLRLRDFSSVLIKASMTVAPGL